MVPSSVHLLSTLLSQQMFAQLKFLAEENREWIQKLVENLKSHYLAQFSGPQYRLWAQAIDVN